MFARHLTPRLREALGDTPAVLLAGGRQTGKTTLAQALSEGSFRARYLTLDDPTLRSAADSDPLAFLADIEGRAVLDEVQQVPALLPLLRREIDRDRRPGRFLLTGSARVLAIPRLAQTLVGRMEVLNLWPLSQGEIDGVREGFADAVFQQRLPALKGEDEGRKDLIDRALRGGFPEAVQRKGRRRAAWFRSYVDLLLQRDVRDLARIEGISSLPRLLELVSARVGGLVNHAEISRTAGIPQTTLKRYFALLEGVFLVVRVRAWSANPSKRLARSPKLFLTDSGLLGHLQRLGPEAIRSRPDLIGPLIENFAAQELLKQLGWSRTASRLSHFRTAGGREVDLVLEDDRGRLVGIEVKSAASVSRSDFRGLETLAECAGQAFHRGLILYAGSEPVSFSPRLKALPLSSLWRLGASRVRNPVPRAPRSEG